MFSAPPVSLHDRSSTVQRCSSIDDAGVPSVPVVGRPRVTANSETGAGGGVIYVLLVLVHLSEVPRQEINNLIGGAAEVRSLFHDDAVRSSVARIRTSRHHGCKSATYAGMPGCPTTQSQHGSVRRAAIALSIAPAPARSVLPPAKQKSETRAARLSDPMRPCTGAVDSVEREVTRPGEA
jgi:hypothetical protein